jgi:hypothetical protein
MRKITVTKSAAESTASLMLLLSPFVKKAHETSPSEAKKLVKVITKMTQRAAVHGCEGDDLHDLADKVHELLMLAERAFDPSSPGT